MYFLDGYTPVGTELIFNAYETFSRRHDVVYVLCPGNMNFSFNLILPRPLTNVWRKWQPNRKKIHNTVIESLHFWTQSLRRKEVL